MEVVKMTKNLYETLQESALEGGELILKCRGKVYDKGKVDSNLIDDEWAAQGIAKTQVDEDVQEILLKKLVETYPDVRINVEEDIPLNNAFRGNQSDITVHCDPCDGTKSYIDGRDEFATGSAISDADNNFTHTVILASARNEMYLASPEGTQVVDTNGEAVTDLGPKDTKKVYAKRILSKQGEQAVREAGYELADLHCSHLGIVDVALGRAGAFLYGKSNPHDSFIPYAFAKANGATMRAVDGTELTGASVQTAQKDGFTVFERVPTVCYFSGHEEGIEKTLLDILADPVNLHESIRGVAA